MKRHLGDGLPPFSPKANHSPGMPGMTLRAPTSAATPILSHLETIRTEAECAVSGHDASVAAMQLVTGWQEFCGREERERKSLRKREKHVNCFLISLPLKALPCHQRKDVPASTDSREPEAGINSTPWGWNQRGASRREKEMKLEEIPNLSAENSMRKEKGFVWRPAESFSNSSWSLKFNQPATKELCTTAIRFFINRFHSEPLLNTIFSKHKMDVAACVLIVWLPVWNILIGIQCPFLITEYESTIAIGKSTIEGQKYSYVCIMYQMKISSWSRWTTSLRGRRKLSEGYCPFAISTENKSKTRSLNNDTKTQPPILICFPLKCKYICAFCILWWIWQVLELVYKTFGFIHLRTVTWSSNIPTPHWPLCEATLISKKPSQYTRRQNRTPSYTLWSFIIFWVKHKTNKHIIWNSLSKIYWIASTVQIELTNETPWTF